MHLWWLALATLSTAAPAAVTPENGTVLPPDAGVLNVKDLGARGDGATDDTQAIRDALLRCQGNCATTVYFPEGTYLVSDQVRLAPPVIMQGSGRTRTTIRLIDGATGYADPRKPKAVVAAGCQAGNAPAPGANAPAYLVNFTIDTGNANPGAVALEFASHGGGLENATIRSGDGQGVCGIDVGRGALGPALCRNVSVEGFNYGVVAGGDVFASVFENLSLARQHTAGVRNDGHPLIIRSLSSSNTVPAVKNLSATGQVVLIDSRLAGGSPDFAAIENRAGGSLFVRNVVVEGYKAAVLEKFTQVGADKVKAEYVSGEVRSLWPMSPGRSLGLAVEETPAMVWDPPAQWESVRSFEARVAGGDWAPAIQAAIDSGKTTVFFPPGTYPVRRTVRLRGRVRTIQGCGSRIQADAEALGVGPALVLDAAGPGPLFIDRLTFAAASPAGFPAIEHVSPATLVILHSRGISYRARPGAGNLFADDVCGTPWHLVAGQKAWIRQLNVVSDQTKIHNEGAQLWILGMTAQGTGTNLVNSSGAHTEILGGQIRPDCPVPDDLPMWVNADAALSLVHTIFWGNTFFILDAHRGQTKELRLPKGHRFIDLYTSTPR